MSPVGRLLARWGLRARRSSRAAAKASGSLRCFIVELQVGRVGELACGSDQFGVQSLGVVIGGTGALTTAGVLRAKFHDVRPWERVVVALVILVGVLGVSCGRIVRHCCDPGCIGGVCLGGVEGGWYVGTSRQAGLGRSERVRAAQTGRSDLPIVDQYAARPGHFQNDSGARGRTTRAGAAVDDSGRLYVAGPGTHRGCQGVGSGGRHIRQITVRWSVEPRQI